MSSIVADLLERNKKNAELYKGPNPLMDGVKRREKLGIKGTVIISCSDPRITPETFLGLKFGEAAIIRNAGGRASDALRSIAALDGVGRVGTVVVIHHTDCGMSHSTEEEFQKKAEENHPAFAKNHPELVYGAINDPEKTIAEDVAFLKSVQEFGEDFEISDWYWTLSQAC